MSEKVVDSFDVFVNIDIVEYDDNTFDWWASNGTESDQLFETAAEAKEDAMRRFR
jgi:hypothetical protein